MHIEPRVFAKGRPEEERMLLLVVDTEEESCLIDQYLGDKIPTQVEGEIQLADGYGEHYIRLRQKHDT